MSSRRAKKDALKAERLARERAAAAAAARRRRLAIGGGGAGAVAVAAIVIAVAASSGGGDGGGGGHGGEARAESFPAGSVPAQHETELRPAAETAGCTLQDPQAEGAGHIEGTVDYASDPPHSGNHNPQPATDGAYTEAPSKESIVHALEHGRIVIWYKPDLPAAQRGALKALFDEDPVHMLLVPNDTMPFQVAATAWTHVLGCERMDDGAFDAIRAFKDEYRDQGPEFVP